MSIDLHFGNCLEVMKTLPAKSIDCFLCDLPYGCLTSGKGKESYTGGKGRSNSYTGCAWDIKIDLEAFWKEVKRLAKDDHTPVLMFATTKFGYELIKSNESWFRYDLVWDKQRGVSFLSANKMPMRSHEMIYVFSKAGAYYKRVDIEGDFKKWSVKRTNQITHCYGEVKKNDTEGGDGKRCVKSVVSIDGHLSRKKGQHPTEKPLELYKWLIERYCPSGGTILDPTAGSFNSCIAGCDLDRHCIGIEMNEDFYKKACKKIEERYA